MGNVTGANVLVFVVGVGVGFLVALVVSLLKLQSPASFDTKVSTR